MFTVVENRKAERELSFSATRFWAKSFGEEQWVNDMAEEEANLRAQVVEQQELFAASCGAQTLSSHRRRLSSLTEFHWIAE